MQCCNCILLPFCIAPPYQADKVATVASSCPTSSTTVFCLTSKTKAPAASSATYSVIKASTNVDTAPDSTMLTKQSGCVDKLNNPTTERAVIFKHGDIESPSSPRHLLRRRWPHWNRDSCVHFSCSFAESPPSPLSTSHSGVHRKLQKLVLLPPIFSIDLITGVSYCGF